MSVPVTVKAGEKSITVPTGLFIDGNFVSSSTGKTFPTFNPANRQKIADVAEASAGDVDAAVLAAKKAFKSWGFIDSYERGQYLYKIAEGLKERSEEFAHLEALDNGKTLKDAKAADLPLTIRTFEFYAALADKFTGHTYDTNPLDFSFTRHEPIGVVGAIIPWNFPLLMLAWKVGPALACGNTLILKTSEKTPLSALLFAKLCQDIGLPNGVLNILSGFGDPVGVAIARHMEIRKVAFTGSTMTGKKVMTMAAESNIKRVTMELGGKSPTIVFDDADLDQAVAVATFGIFFNHGQCCCAGSRIYVQEGIYDEFVKRFVEKAKKIKLGDQFDPTSEQGPQVDEIQFKRILSYLESARAEGVEIACGGNAIGEKGYYIEPTLFINGTEENKVSKEEIFGPVACAFKFKTEQEVIERANNTNYGLAAAVFTKDLSRAFRMERLLEAGTVWINCYDAFDLRVPFGGFKESGFGREMSAYALDSYTNVKAVRIALSPA